MHTLNNTGIQPQSSGKLASGQVLGNRQLANFASNSDRVFPSVEACTKLEIISDTFPTISEVHSVSSSTPDFKETNNKIITNTHKLYSIHRASATCQLPSPKPIELRLPVTDDNLEKIEQ